LAEQERQHELAELKRNKKAVAKIKVTSTKKATGMQKTTPVASKKTVLRKQSGEFHMSRW
jgi:hypothetical protein